jgi:hypothetical protein
VLSGEFWGDAMRIRDAPAQKDAYVAGDADGALARTGCAAGDTEVARGRIVMNRRELPATGMLALSFQRVSK